MGELTASLREKMRQDAQAVKEHLAGSGDLKRWDLYGKQAIVEPGKQVIVRLLPRWDYKQKFMRQGDKIVINPAYEPDRIYMAAKEHWWDGLESRMRIWCPKSFDPKAPCPVCEASMDLKASRNQDDKKLAKEIMAKDVYIFNAVIGGVGKRAMKDDGTPDIRMLALNNTLFDGIMRIMLGSGEEGDSFSREDIADPTDGYDLLLTRPLSQGDRWKVDPAAKPSRLFLETEKALWKGWLDRLYVIPDEVAAETKEYDEVFKLYHGEENKALTAGSEPANAIEAGNDLAGFEAEVEEAPAAVAGSPSVDDVGVDFELPDDPPAAAAKPAPRAALPPPARRPGTPAATGARPGSAARRK